MTEERQGPTQGVCLKEVSANRVLTVLRIFFFNTGCRWYSFRRRWLSFIVLTVSFRDWSCYSRLPSCSIRLLHGDHTNWPSYCRRDCKQHFCQHRLFYAVVPRLSYSWLEVSYADCVSTRTSTAPLFVVGIFCSLFPYDACLPEIPARSI